MAKNKSRYVCQNCGYSVSKWMGKCPSCESWNTLVEEIEESRASGVIKKRDVSNKIYKVSDIETTEGERIRSGIEEFDRVLGGGLIKGSLVLVGGDPGIGKSTLLLKTCDAYSKIKKNILYVSAEESLRQIKLRAERMNVISDSLYLMAENDLDIVLNGIENIKPDILILDSIQTLHTETISSAPGSVSQVRELTNVFMKIAKTKGISTFIVGHVTKQGMLAGPKVLEHMVDTVLYFEGDGQNQYRIIRAVKNRFGSTNEVGIFEMVDSGIEAVKNPSASLLSERSLDASGTVVVTSVEGTRPMMHELQALMTPTSYGVPRRLTTGIDQNRLLMILAVLEKYLNVQVQFFDCYANVAGGMSVKEPGLDLGILAAIYSSIQGGVIGNDWVLIGEVGLTGEIRSVTHLERRLKEAEQLGFNYALIPNKNLDRLDLNKFKIKPIGISRVEEIVEKLF